MKRFRYPLPKFCFSQTQLRLTATISALANLNAYDENSMGILLDALQKVSLLRFQSQDCVDLVDAFVKLRVCHVPFLDRLVEWYETCMRTNMKIHGKLSSDQLEVLARMTEGLWNLGFVSQNLTDLCSDSLTSANTPKLRVMLLHVLAQLTSFTPNFRTTLMELVEDHQKDPSLYDFVYNSTIRILTILSFSKNLKMFGLRRSRSSKNHRRFRHKTGTHIFTAQSG